MNADTTNITFRIRRYTPQSGQPPTWQEYRVRLRPGMTVLDGLQQIRDEQDATLSWRSSCRMGICGSCAMVINGQPRLACHTQILEVATKLLRLEPLWNFDVIKDLVPDLMPMFAKHASVQPYLQRSDSDEQEQPTREYRQTPEELTEYLQFSYCISCGACVAACPTSATDTQYLGPMPLAAAQRYSADKRDAGFVARVMRVAGDHGVFHCHYAGECSRVCPKGVDPARAVQWLKRRLVAAALGRAPRVPAPVVAPPVASGKPSIAAPPLSVRKEQ